MKIINIKMPIATGIRKLREERRQWDLMFRNGKIVEKEIVKKRKEEENGIS